MQGTASGRNPRARAERWPRKNDPGHATESQCTEALESISFESLALRSNARRPGKKIHQVLCMLSKAASYLMA